MKSFKMVRVAGLCLALSISALATFANAAGPERCSCSYCPTVNSTTKCIGDNGAQTCGSWLAVTLCPAG